MRERICVSGYLHQCINFSSSIMDFLRLQGNQESDVVIFLANQKQNYEPSKGFGGETPRDEGNPESTAQDESRGMVPMVQNHVSLQPRRASVSVSG